LDDVFRSVFDGAKDFMAVIDERSIIIEINEAAVVRLDATKPELIGQPITNFFPPALADFRKEQYKNAFKSQSTQSYESERNGLWSETVLSPIFNDQGEVMYLSVVARDITTQKIAEQELDRSVETMQNLFDLGFVGMALTSAEKKWLRVNDQLCEMLGYSREELLQMTWGDVTHPDYLAPNEIPYSQVLAGEKAGYSFDKTYIRKDGGEIFVSVSSRCFRNSDGGIEYFITLINDITERKNNVLALQKAHDELEERIAERTAALTQEIGERRRTEEALLKSEERFRDFAVSAADSYWEFDKNLVLTYMSAAAPAPNFWNEESVIGKTVAQLQPDTEENKELRKELIRAFESQKPFRNLPSVETDLDNKKLHFRRSAIPLFDSDGKFSGYRGITVNVTEVVEERARAAAELKKKSESEELLHRISASANEASSVKEAFQACLDVICDITGWSFGCVWVVAEDQPTRIVSADIWRIVNSEKFEPLKDYTVGLEIKPGEGRIGQVFKTGQAYWSPNIADEVRRPRAQMIYDCGGQGAVLSPVRIGGEVAAIFEFVVEDWHDMDRLYSSSLEQIEIQLGHVIARERAKEALRASEERLRDFAESGADRFWETDENLKYTFVSQPVGSLTNSVEYLLGKSPWEVGNLKLEQNQDNWQYLKETMAARQPFRNFRYTWTNNEGQKCFLRASGNPYFDSAAKFKGYRGITVDETAEVKAKEQAEDIRQRFFDAMENLDAGFILWGPDDRLIMSNSFIEEVQPQVKDILKPGLSYEEFVRANAKTDWAESNSFGGEDWVEMRLRQHNSPKSELEYHLDDGRWFRVRKQKLRDGSTIAFHVEITNSKRRENELNQAIQEAEAANRTKSEFLANMSHELRTPLNAIIGFSDALAHGVFGSLANNRQLEYLDNINEAGTHLLELINDILDVSTIEAGQLELNINNTNLGEIVESALRLVEQRARDRGVELENHLNDEKLLVSVDTLRMKQVFVNLMSNAIKFTPEGGKVTMNVRKVDNSGLAIEISDTGVGMDEVGIKKALMTFGQVQSDLSREEEGTGLGIPLTKGLVEAHGGTLEIQSKLGVGTTVTVNLPHPLH